jgi:hypothetical protein
VGVEEEESCKGIEFEKPAKDYQVALMIFIEVIPFNYSFIVYYIKYYTLSFFY